jgi:glycerol-3-phosphate dehydrogenase
MSEAASKFDVAIIGAGVVGASIARKLSQYDLKVAVLEKSADVSFGVSKANSGIIHGSFHYRSDTLKGRLEIAGNLRYDQLQKELHFPFRRCGILVAAFTTEEMRRVETLYQNGLDNGAIGIELCNRERMLSLEPKLNPDIVGGLHAPGGGIIEPYRFVFALMESAVKNGVVLHTDFRVTRSDAIDFGGFRIHAADGRVIEADWAVNAAGLYADEVSSAFGAEDFTITPRKGEEFLLDRNASAYTNKVVFPVPSKHSKGMLVIPTVEGTTMVGPTASIQEDKEDHSTSRENFSAVFASARRMVPVVSERDIITSFSGLRPVLDSEDFYIDVSGKQPRLIQAAGIQSPGLTAAPAVADYVKDLLKDAGLDLHEKPGYDPTIAEIARFRTSSQEEREALIEQNSSYGEIICRCESVSEAEIVEAIRHGHDTLDGVKFYTRAQMGRCQGGFCTYRILQIIARETGKDMLEISKRGAGSELLKFRVGERSAFETDPHAEIPASAGEVSREARP